MDACQHLLPVLRAGHEAAPEQPNVGSLGLEDVCDHLPEIPRSAARPLPKFGTRRRSHRPIERRPAGLEDALRPSLLLLPQAGTVRFPDDVRRTDVSRCSAGQSFDDLEGGRGLEPHAGRPHRRRVARNVGRECLQRCSLVPAAACPPGPLEWQAKVRLLPISRYTLAMAPLATSITRAATATPSPIDRRLMAEK